jgi:hypothetical protein
VESTVADWIFDALALIFFVVLLRILWSSKNDPKFATAGNAAVAAVVAAFCALMGNPDQFQKMSFSVSNGVVVEARQTIWQAQVTLTQLQKLGSLMGQFMIEEDAARGRLGNAPSAAEHEALRKSVLELLKSISLPEAAVADRKWVAADYVIPILSAADSRVPVNKRSEWTKFSSPYTEGTLDYKEITPDKLEGNLNELGIMDAQIKSMIDDYRYYLITGIQRHSRSP